MGLLYRLERGFAQLNNINQIESAPFALELLQTFLQSIKKALNTLCIHA